jgi:hypothetical protein
LFLKYLKYVIILKEVGVETMKLRKDRVFILISMIFLCTLISIYTYRFIHYYRLENGNTKEVVNNDNYFYQRIISSNKIIDATTGLFENDNEYVFRGNIENNYVLYDNILYRIIKIEKNNNIKLIAEDSLTSLVWGYKSDYKSSYVKSWLNTKFKNNINNEYLVKSETCIDKIDDIGDYSCNDKYNDDEVVLLSMEEYINAGGKNSYLKNNKTFWIVNATSDNEAWSIGELGGLSDIVNLNDTYKLYGVRPVITITGKTDIPNGEGTKENPYIISKITPSILSEASIGSYINFSDNIYKIVDKLDENNIKVALNGYLNNDDGYIYKKYAKVSSVYNVKNNENLAYYLNNTFFKNLKNNDYLVSSDWNLGKYSIDNEYNYIFQDTINTKVGLLNIGDLYINDFGDTFTMTRTNEVDDTIYVVNANGSASANFVNIELKIRPAFYLSKSLTITSGEGTIDKPYELNR